MSLQRIAAFTKSSIVSCLLFVVSSPTTRIFPSVNVPVLSQQIVLTDPKVSAAKSFLTKAFFFSILCIPKLRMTVKVTTKPSGIAATATATLVVNI